MMKVVAFAGSNSQHSINKQLVTFAARQFENATVLDINDFEMPLFGVDYEAEQGIPKQAEVLSNLIGSADLILLSLAEHNGAYTVAFKNIFDWMSRIPNRTVFRSRPVFLMATSPGARGASSVLAIGAQRFPFNGADVVDTFSLPKFYENFDKENGITDDNLRKTLLDKLNQVKTNLQEL